MAKKNTTEIAEWYGVTNRTIHTWIKNGLPIFEKGSDNKQHIFNTEDAHSWLVEREIARRVVKSDGQQYDRAEEEARLKHHQANNEALKEAETTGAMIPRDLVVDLCAATVSNARAKLLTVSNKLKNQFPGLDDEAINAVEDLHLQALEDLGNDGIPRGLQERISRYSEDVETADEANG